jgi:DNA-binding beta-propeller fold protein YncE
MRLRLAMLPLLLALASAFACTPRRDAAKGGTVGKLAPGFDGATAWLNVDHPLKLEELRGKVVVVDFWTSCCINCIHTLPILARVEHDFARRPVVVVGVHSAKFDVEAEQGRLREILSEYAIVHPVAVDGAMKLWDAWGVQAWPTVLVLDATGHVTWTGSGEPAADALEGAVTAALEAGERAGVLSKTPLAGLRHEPDRSGPLSYPGKVIVLRDGSLAIADTGHHRVVFAGTDGAVKEVAGGGLAGFTDGGFAEASFRKPRGLAEVGDLVYVADTENHAVRVIDRHARRVTTVAGTGELGAGPLGAAVPARSARLRSPWDLVATGGVVYVALAGSHQIAALRPDAGTIEAFAGDGEERRLDGAGAVSSFAQPSGLATDGKSLFVADAETSSLREVSLATRDVHTLVGQDLFVFGDVDGPAPRVRLEHPVGVAWSEGALFVADTYNSKVKRLDLATGVVKTLAGGRDHELLFEPEGIAVHGPEIFVADTKHHRVAVLSAESGAARPLELRGLTAPSVGVAVAQPAAAPSASSPRIVLGDVPIAGVGTTALHFDWDTPTGTGINEEAPFRVTWTSSDGLASVPTPIRSTGATVQRGFDLAVTPIAGAEGGKLEGDLSLVLCDTSTHLVCVPVRRAIEVSFRVATKAEAARVVIPLPAAKP